MDFLIRLPADGITPQPFLSFDGTGEPGSEFTADIPADGAPSRRDILFDSGHAVFIGDPVFHDRQTSQLIHDLETSRIETIIREVDGFYYLLVIYHRLQKLIISSGSFSILPVFYSVDRDMLSISSSFDLLLSKGSKKSWTPDQQYYLEKALFNYPLFNRTPVKGINLLPSNSFIEYCSSKFIIRKHTNISDYFTGSPEPWRKAKDRISDLFVEKAGDFVPESSFAVAMTGGLDSRTVAGISSVRGHLSAGYTYGRQQDHDLIVASAIARFLKLNFIPVILDENYAREHFWNYGLKFLTGSYGLGNISRAHYSLIAENYLKQYRYLLTGNFGSEILRSARIAGVVTSGALFRAFSPADGEDPVKILRSEPALNYLNPSVMNENLADVTDELSDYLDSMPSGLTVNQRFYTYIFEEVFRKYFGPEIISQRPFVSHRAPFLCFRFIESILKTAFAGANSDFMETNPLKRIHGQILHASILQKTNPALLDFRLDRGYKPKDLLTYTGAMKILLEYLNKRHSGSYHHASPEYITLSLAENMDHFPGIQADDNIFDAGFISRMRKGQWISDQVNFVNIMSAVMFRNIIAGRPA